MRDDVSPDPAASARVEAVCEALRAQFGDRACAVAEEQMGRASGEALGIWIAVVERLRA